MNYGYQIVKNGLVICLDAIEANSLSVDKTRWRDLTGNNYGRLIHDSLLYDIKDNSSFFLNGIDGALYIGDTSLVSGNTQTISFWFKKHHNGRANGKDVIFQGYAFGNNGWFIYLDATSSVNFQILINSVIYEISGQQIQSGIWYNVAISFNSNGFLKGYLNGVLVGAVSIPEFTIAPYYIAISSFCTYIANVLFYNRVLSDLEILKNYNAFVKRFVVTAVPSLVTSGLVMNLDASKVNSYDYSNYGIYWYDLSGYNNHGTINSAYFEYKSEGNFEFSYSRTSYVSVANSASLNSTAQTISVWYYMTVNATTETLITKHNTADESNGYRILGSGSIQMKVSTTTTNAGLNLVPVNDWYLLTATFSANSTMRTYVNGVVSGSAVAIGNLVLSTNAIRIGRSPHLSGQPLTGHIAQVTIYNRVLTATEILQNFNATKTKFGY